jgi:hypothetical protein
MQIDLGGMVRRHSNLCWIKKLDGRGFRQRQRRLFHHLEQAGKPGEKQNGAA